MKGTQNIMDYLMLRITTPELWKRANDVGSNSRKAFLVALYIFCFTENNFFTVIAANTLP